MSLPLHRTPHAALPLLATGACVWLAGCGATPDENPPGSLASGSAQARQSIIYDSDDRRDVYGHPEPALGALVASSVVALIPRPTLNIDDDGSVELSANSLEAAYQLCPGTRFADQPSAAACSGVLVDRDLVLTAAHCLKRGLGEELSCEQHAYVFDYFYRAEGTLEPITRDDVFGCTEIVALTHPQGVEHGLALVRLDREVDAARLPVSLGRERPAVGEPAAVLGFPSGLPAKIDTGASVLGPAPDATGCFELDSDTFGSSSGSGVFDERRELIGVLLSGGRDYDTAEAGCQQIHQVSAANAKTFERAAYTDWIEAALAANARGAVADATAASDGGGALTCAASPVRQTWRHGLLGYAWIVMGTRRRARRPRPRIGSTSESTAFCVSSGKRLLRQIAERDHP